MGIKDFTEAFSDPSYDTVDQAAEQKYGVPAGMVSALRLAGERTNASKVSKAGARTPYQFTAATRKAVLDKYGIDAYLSPDTAAESAAILLRDSLKRNNGNEEAAIREYHGGTDKTNWGTQNNAYYGRVATHMQNAKVDAMDSDFKKFLAENPAVQPIKAPEEKAAAPMDERQQGLNADFQSWAKANPPGGMSAAPGAPGTADAGGDPTAAPGSEALGFIDQAMTGAKNLVMNSPQVAAADAGASLLTGMVTGIGGNVGAMAGKIVQGAQGIGAPTDPRIDPTQTQMQDVASTAVGASTAMAHAPATPGGAALVTGVAPAMEVATALGPVGAVEGAALGGPAVAQAAAAAKNVPNAVRGAVLAKIMDKIAPEAASAVPGAPRAVRAGAYSTDAVKAPLAPSPPFVKQVGDSVDYLTAHAVPMEKINDVVMEAFTPAEAASNLELLTWYHGSPHMFDAFDASKIGTGEGAQMVAHGIYVGELESTAKHYQATLGGPMVVPDWMNGTVEEARAGAATVGIKGPKSLMVVDDLHATHEKIREQTAKGIFVGKPLNAAEIASDAHAEYGSTASPAAYVNIAKKIFQQGEGNLYKGTVPKRIVDDMLQWEQPIGEQSAVVKAAAAKVIEDDPALGARLHKQLLSEAQAKLRNVNKTLKANPKGLSANDEQPAQISARIKALKTGGPIAAVHQLTGEEFHMMIEDGLPIMEGTTPKVDTAEQLRQLGVSGVKYWDGQSRKAGDGTKNYILFPGNEHHFRVTDRNGVRVHYPFVRKIVEGSDVSHIEKFTPSRPSGDLKRAEPVAEPTPAPPRLPAPAPEPAIPMSPSERGLPPPAPVVAGPEPLGGRSPPVIAPLSRPAPSPVPGGGGAPGGSVGAAAVDPATQRRMAAESLPVPMKLTKGQAERDARQQGFEKSVAETDPGKNVHARFQEQRLQLEQNIDAFIDATGAEQFDLRGVGEAVMKPLRARAAKDKVKIRTAYKEAEKSAEGETPTTLDAVVNHLNDNSAEAEVSNVLKGARAKALKLGIAEEMPDGSLATLPTTLKNGEIFRRSINQMTNNDPVNIRQAALIKSAYDAETESLGGRLYKRARNLRRLYSKNYEDVGLIKNLLGTKRGSEDRAIALEDVVKKSIQGSSLDSIRHLRKILTTEGEDGKQAWMEIQGATLRSIKDVVVGRDGAVNSKALDTQIKILDRGNKLDFIFGKKGAEQLRTLADVANYVVTTVPKAGGKNDMVMTLSLMVDAALTTSTSLHGIPIPLPIATGIRMGLGKLKNARLERRIADALK